MGIVIRQSLKATIVSYTGIFLGAFTVILLNPYCLTPEQIGLTKVLLEAGLFFSFYAQMGMSNVAIKFFPYFKDSQKNHNGFAFIITFIPFIGFIVFCIAFILFKQGIISLFAEKSKLFTEYILYLIPITLFWVYTNVFEAYSSILQRIVVPKINKELFVRILTIGIIILFFFKKINLNQFVFLFVCIYGLSMVVNIMYIHAIQPFKLKPNFEFLTRPLMKEMGIFLLFMLIAGSGSSVSSKIDTYMISTMSGLADLGIYTTAFYIATFIEIPTRSIFQISAPMAANALKQNDMVMVNTLYKKGSINQLIIGGFLFLLIWANVDNMYSIMPHGDVYQKGKYVILLIGLSKVFDAVTSINAAILSNSKYFYYALYFIFLLAGLAILNNLFFIPLYGITGAAIATAISIFLYNAILVWFVWWKMKIQPFTIQTIKAILVIVVLFVLNLVIYKFSNPFLDGIARSSILTAIFAVAIIKLKISPDLNAVLMTITNRIKTLDFRK